MFQKVISPHNEQLFGGKSALLDNHKQIEKNIRFYFVLCATKIQFFFFFFFFFTKRRIFSIVVYQDFGCVGCKHVLSK
jgi:hypothetical protein